MKYINTIRNFVVASFIGVAGVASAQHVVQPLSFGTNGTAAVPNFYKDYVGVRFQVCSPSAIAGDKVYTTGYNTGTSSWGGAPTNMFCKAVKFATPDTDACATTAFSSGLFTGKIALIWRGNCQFGTKALKAQNAGADAVVIVNNVDGGPVGMAAGTDGASVHIPVYMISLADGTDIINQIHASTSVTMTIIVNWSTGNGSDLGFVPAGFSISANNAMPWSQINANPANGAYAMKPGAYVANYGVHNQTGVKLSSTLNWTPAGGSSSQIHADTVIKGAFPTADSIWAMFMPKYSLPTTLTGPGKFDLKYTISSDSTDGFTGDNALTYSFYATDSLFSKGRYDFANNRPVTTEYTGPSSLSTDPYIWSVPYYVANGGSYANSVQFSVVNGTGLLPTGDQFYVYLFKWVDAAATMDSFMENSELQLVGTALYTFGGTDSAFKTYTAIVADTNGNPAAIPLNANSWYVVSAEAPSTLGYALGCDGVLSGYPRSFGLRHFEHIAEYYNPIWYTGNRKDWVTSAGAAASMWANPGAALYPWAFDGTGSYEVDSVVYTYQKGLIPSLPLITTSHVNSVASVNSVFSKLELYPNPTANQLNVSIGLDKPASLVTYSVIDATGKFVSRESHNNVQSEVYSLNTSNLANGVYYMIVAADGKTSSRKFTVLK